MDDDLMPNDGAFFNPWVEPREQIVERKKETAQSLESLNVIKDIIKRLDERIAFYNTNEGISDEVLDDPKKFMHWVAANKLTVSNLKSEREWVNSLLDLKKR